MRQELARFSSTLPAGTQISVFYDQSVLIGEAMAACAMRF